MTTSALALVGTTAFFGIATPQPAAACIIDVSGASGAINNAGSIDCINIHGAVVTGNVSNTGSLGNGIVISNSTINGQVTDSGTILGGIRADSSSSINSTATGIVVGPTSMFGGGVVNNGTITGSNGIERNTVSTIRRRREQVG